jgi:hypothetical protein
VGGRPQRHVLAEDPVPDVVERKGGEAEGRAAEEQQGAEGHAPAAGDPYPRAARVALVREPDAQEASGEHSEEAEQHRVVPRIAEGALVAPVVDVVADVPVAADHREEQGGRRDEDGQRAPRRYPEDPRGQGAGAG